MRGMLSSSLRVYACRGSAKTCSAVPYSTGSPWHITTDIVWDQAPFRTHGDFVAAVAGTADDFLRRGLFTAAEKDTVVSAAARAKAQLTP